MKWFWLVCLSGCVPTHLAAIEADGSGGGSAGEADDTDDTGATDVAGTCDVPMPLPSCDEAADPLRAAEFSCYDGISAATFTSDDPSAWRSVHEYGNAFWVAEDTSAVMVLSTGTLPDPNTAGQIVLDAGAGQLQSADNDNPDGATLPAPVEPDFGATANDLLWLSFDADVPDEAHGYRLRFGMLTAEFPERIGDEPNDTFVWWASSEAFTGNLATYDGLPATVTGLADPLGEQTVDHPMLLRTGFDGATGEPCSVDGAMVPSCPIGGATGWMELRGPAEPGERISIVAALFDQGDALLDTVVVLDGFRWTCDGCEPGRDCGLR